MGENSKRKRNIKYIKDKSKCKKERKRIKYVERIKKTIVINVRENFVINLSENNIKWIEIKKSV